MYKKKGYTLIELIIVIGILAIISSIAALNVIKAKGIVNKISLEDSLNETRGILSFGKNYCRKNKVNGKFMISNNKLHFIVQEIGHEINKSTEEKIGLEIGASNLQIRIDKDGYITEGSTIVLGFKGNYKEIKIGVGNDIIGISEVDIID